MTENSSPNPNGKSPRSESLEMSHRGAFGEYGGDEKGFIDRTFRERILLVGVAIAHAGFRQTMDSLNELARLVKTAGADPIEKVITKRPSIHPSTYLGKGKVEELADTCEHLDIDTVVFDHDLTPVQQINLEKMLGRSAIDRTTVILDIFAQNTSSLEGKVQVELAQLKHRTARLGHSRHRFSQQAGGIGSRGPGETKLETDRRAIARKVTHLENQLKEIIRRRAGQAKRRRDSSLFQVALAGYTNAGKSTLLNLLTDSTELCQNRLFSTLDAVTRQLHLPDGRVCLITDTVGFIRKLPHTLVEAFASTLAGITEADLILHIQDASASDMETQMTEVKNVLQKIGAEKIPNLLVFNKIDSLSVPALNALKQSFPDGIFISAETGEGIENLTAAVSAAASQECVYNSLLVPFDLGDVMADIHRTARVINSKSTEGGMFFEVELPRHKAERFLQYATEKI